MTRPAIPHPLLRTALQLDAAASGAMGLALVLAAGLAATPLGLPEPLLRAAGLVLLPFAVGVGYAGTRTEVPRRASVLIVAINALWVAASVLLLVIDGPASPTALGVGFVVLQAVVVLALAEAQWMGLRRPSRRAATA